MPTRPPVARLHAWADESMRTLGVTQPTYLLGATLADPGECDVFRETLRALHRGGRKLHWRDLTDTHRTRVIRTIQDLALDHLIILGTPLDPPRQERARALCLERLMWELERLGVTQLDLEAREPSLMSRDLRTVRSLRGRGVISNELRVDHGRPSADAMLWVPDQVVGAVAESLAGRTRWLDSMGDSVELIEIDV